MQVQVHTDRNIEGSAELAARVEAVVADTLSRFADRLTNVEVHLSDVNSSNKGGDDDIRCTMEARLAGLKPLAVTQAAATIDQAVDNAAERLREKLSSAIGKQRDSRP